MEPFTELNLDVDTMEMFETFENTTFSFYNDFNETEINVKEQSFIFIPYILVCAFGLVGNAFVLYVILRFRKMWTPVNIYVFSLALGDIISMLCLLFFATEIASTYWPLGTFICKLFWTLNSLTPLTSIYFLAILAINVFIQQYFPEFSKKTHGRHGPKIAALVSLVAWIACLLLSVPLFIFADMDTYYNCRIFWPEPYAFWNLTFLAYRLVVAFLLPLLLSCIFLILTAVSYFGKDNSTKSSGAIIKENMSMAFVLLAVFVIFWLPSHVLEMMSAVVGDLSLSQLSYFIISLIPYLKSCIYPILYGFLSQSFKQAFTAVFCCKNLQDNNSSTKDCSEKPDEKLSAC